MCVCVPVCGVCVGGGSVAGGGGGRKNECDIASAPVSLADISSVFHTVYPTFYNMVEKI